MLRDREMLRRNGETELGVDVFDDETAVILFQCEEWEAGAEYWY